MSLEIVSVSADEGLLPARIPSLMPFHVSYSGPAPVSRYLRPRPAPSPSSGSPMLSSRYSSSPTLVASSSTTSIVGGGVSSLTTMSSTASVVGGPTRSQENESLAKTEPAVVTQVEQLTLVENASVEMEMDSETQPTLDTVPRDNLSGSTVHIDAPRTTERLVTAFRGRQMYGQGVDIPKGYGGLVLRTPLSSEGDATMSLKLSSQKNKPKSRTRVATRRKRAMADESAEERDGEEDRDSAADRDMDPPPPARKLIPSSQFTSFTLWTSDRPLDEGRDEYARTLIEWTRLASEIHSYDE